MSRSTGAFAITTALAAASTIVLVGCGSSGKSASNSAGGAPSTAASGAAKSSAPTGSSSSSGTSAGTKGDPSNPCTLLTDSEASGWLGGSVSHIGPKTEENGTACVWTAGARFLTVLVGHGSWDPTHLPGDPVSGIGDGAIVGSTLAAAHKGNVVVIVTGAVPEHYKDALSAAVGRL